MALITTFDPSASVTLRSSLKASSPNSTLMSSAKLMSLDECFAVTIFVRMLVPKAESVSKRRFRISPKALGSNDFSAVRYS